MDGGFLDCDIKVEEEELKDIDSSPEGILPIKTEKNQTKEQSDPKIPTYYCAKCTFETSWKCYLKSHIKKIHSSDAEAEIFKCLKCNFQTRWKFSLRNHMKVHSPPSKLKMFKCSKCSYQTKWMNGITSHMKVHLFPKTEKAAYKCSECGLEVGSKVKLAEHERTHSSQEMFKCPKCDFKTTFRHGVNKHIKVHYAK